MSRTFRNTPPRYTRATTSPQPEPVAARDGKVYTGRRKECTGARRATLREYRAQCRQALHHGREFPPDPRTEGWLTW